MRTIETTLYTFNELSEKAQELAIKREMDNPYRSEYIFLDHVIDYFKDTVEHFDIDKVYYSGFYSQGDGAMFEGSIVGEEIIKHIEPNYRNDGYKRDFERVLKLIKSGEINLYGNYKHSGRYYHEKSYSGGAEYEFVNGERYDYSNIESVLDDIIELVDEAYEDLCVKIYSSLKEEYEYRYSEECIREELQDIDYEYTEDGERY